MYKLQKQKKNYKTKLEKKIRKNWGKNKKKLQKIITKILTHFGLILKFPGGLRAPKINLFQKKWCSQRCIGKSRRI